MRYRLIERVRAALFIFVFSTATLIPIDSSSETLTRSVDVSSPEQIEAVFLQGLRFINEGEPRKAVILFRKILARHPDLPRVRLELARAYFLMASWSQSRSEFVAVLSGDIPSPVKRNVLRFIRTIDARRGFDWDIALGISTGPEGNRRYESDTVELEFLGRRLPFEVEREKSDVIGLAIEGSTELRKRFFGLADGPAVVGFATASADIFKAGGSKHDDYIFGASAGSRLIWPRTTALAAASASIRYRSGGVYENRQGLRSAIEFRTETGLATLLSAAYTDVNVRDSQSQDGSLYSLRAGLSKSFLGSANVGAFLELETFDALSAFESYDAIGLNLLGRSDLGHGIGATVRVGLTRRDYAEKIPFFPDRRDDLAFDADIDLVKNNVFLFGQFSPFVRLGYTHNKSSVDIFSYDEYRFLLGMKNAF